jgi:hypothetical protein
MAGTRIWLAPAPSESLMDALWKLNLPEFRRVQETFIRLAAGRVLDEILDNQPEVWAA